MCLGKKSGQREEEKVLGQGDRGGDGPAARAAEVNASPVHFLASLVKRQRWADFFPRHTPSLAQHARAKIFFDRTKTGLSAWFTSQQCARLIVCR